MNSKNTKNVWIKIPSLFVCFTNGLPRGKGAATNSGHAHFDSRVSIACQSSSSLRGPRTSMAASSVFKPGLFKHKVAIVTGGGTGIGKAIAAELLELGGSNCGFVSLSVFTERLSTVPSELRHTFKRSPGSSLFSAHTVWLQYQNYLRFEKHG